MIGVEITNLNSLVAFWLVFTRLLAAFIQFPVFDHVSVPNTVKVLGTLTITYCFYPFLVDPMLKDIETLGASSFWVLTIYNLLVGLLLGFFLKAIMSLFSAAGSLMTQQMGFSAMRYFDPTQAQSSGPFEILLQWTMTVIILTSGALIPIFKGVYESFFSVNYLNFARIFQAPEFFFIFFKDLFLSSLLLASPFIFANLLVMCVLGIIARTVPQMNVLIVSFSVNIGLGLLVLLLTVNEFFTTGFSLYTEYLGQWYGFFTQ